VAMFIEIKKIHEDEKEVFYSFLTPEGDFGKVSITKETFNFCIIEEPGYDKESKLATRVGIKLAKHWEKGEFPDITCWAS
jgi:hypothetical protein